MGCGGLVFTCEHRVVIGLHGVILRLLSAEIVCELARPVRHRVLCRLSRSETVVPLGSVGSLRRELEY